MLSGLYILGPTRTIYDESYYEPVIAEFERLSEVKKLDRSVLLARYDPANSSVESKIHNDHQKKKQKRPENKQSTSPADKQDEKTERINLRYAGKEELMTLPGIGPVTANRILAYREENGPFEKPEDLLNVSGIGPVTLENIREYILIEEKKSQE